jgi:hypothetical protein
VAVSSIGNLRTGHAVITVNVSYDERDDMYPNGSIKKCEEKKPLGRLSCKKDNIKANTKTEWEDVNWIY